MGFDGKLFVRDGSSWVERTPGAGLAAELSRELHTIAVEWSIQTTVDQIWIIAYREGQPVREVRYASGEGWTRWGQALAFENKVELARWFKKRRLLASPDGYEVLDAFLGVRPPQPVVDPGATYSASLSPAQATELRAIADRANATVSAVFEASWHLGKRAVYDRLMVHANRLGLDLTMLVDDVSPPPPLERLPAFVHEPVEVQTIDITRYKTAIEHGLALSKRMLSELERMSTMFDVRKYELLDETYLLARPYLV